MRLLMILCALWMPSVLVAGESDKVGYLGVATDFLPPSVRAQIDVPREVGLLVTRVMDDSPASKVDLQQHDVLVKFEDQLLVNTGQLQSLIRMKGPEAVIELTLVRRGKTLKIEVELGTMPAHQRWTALQFTGQMGGPQFFVPQEGDMQLEWQHVLPVRPNPENRSYEFEFSPEHRITLEGDVEKRKIITRLLESTGQILWADGEHMLKVDVKDGVRQLTVTALVTGEELWSGPISTDEQKAEIPEAYRDKFKMLERTGTGGEVRIENLLKDLEDGTHLKIFSKEGLELKESEDKDAQPKR